MQPSLLQVVHEFFASQMRTNWWQRALLLCPSDIAELPGCPENRLQSPCCRQGAHEPCRWATPKCHQNDTRDHSPVDQLLASHSPALRRCEEVWRLQRRTIAALPYHTDPCVQLIDPIASSHVAPKPRISSKGPVRSYIGSKANKAEQHNSWKQRSKHISFNAAWTQESFLPRTTLVSPKVTRKTKVTTHCFNLCRWWFCNQHHSMPLRASGRKIAIFCVMGAQKDSTYSVSTNEAACKPLKPRKLFSPGPGMHFWKYAAKMRFNVTTSITALQSAVRLANHRWSQLANRTAWVLQKFA